MSITVPLQYKRHFDRYQGFDRVILTETMFSFLFFEL